MASIIIKSPEQIEGIRRSSKLAGNTLKYIAPFVKGGVTTDYLDQLIRTYIKDHGAIAAPLNYMGFPKSSCISVNEVVCHGIPSSAELKDGDIVNIDVTTILDGYFGDTSTMFEIGNVSDDAKKLIAATKRAIDIGIEQVFPMNKFGNIGFAIGRYIQTTPYSIVYEFCGHGVGLEFHEAPQVEHLAKFNTGHAMKPGMIFTIEPMINQGTAKTRIDKKDGWTARTRDGKLSAQFEHTILVTEHGCEVLTDVDGAYPIR